MVLDDLPDAADLAGLAGRPGGQAAGHGGESGGRIVRARDAGAAGAGLQHQGGDGLPVRRLGTDPDQRSGAIDLVGDLGCEPPALGQASAVIVSSGMSCRDYRHHFMQRQKRLAEAGRSEPSAAAVTWTFSAEYAEHLSPGVSIRSLVTLAAMLDGRAIPGTVFTTAAVGKYLAGDDGQPADPQRAWNAILGLRQAGLLAVDPPGACPSSGSAR